MDNYINLYNGTITAGLTDGKLVDEANKILAITKAGGDEVCQELAVRCEKGYAPNGDITLSFTSSKNTDKWCFEYNGVKANYGESITISDLSTTNTIFKVYAKAGANEKPSVDKEVKIEITGEVIATA